METDTTPLEHWVDALAGTGVFCAYNANVDAIVDVDPSLEPVLGDPSSVPDVLAEPAGLAAAIVRTMAQGEGDELPMDPELGDWLESRLEPDERRMGGQAGIMTDTLSVLGASPAITTYLLSDAQRALFQRPGNVRVPVARDGLDFVPVMDVPPADRTKTNWIFEFEAGDTLYGTTASASTRFIAASRPDAFDLDVGELGEHARELGERVDCAVLSGYHSLRDRYPDGSTAVDRIERGRTFLAELRKTTPVQVEYGVTHDAALRAAVAERIAPLADVVSVDTRELDFLCRDLGLPEPDETAVDRYRAVRDVRAELDVPAVKLHATDHFLAATDGYDAADAVADGFRFASIVAAAKARNGTLTGVNDLQDGVAVEPSAEGMAAVRNLAAAIREGDMAPGGAPVAVPNRVVDDPVSTVGIGDAVSCTSFVLEQSLAQDSSTDS